MTTASPIDAELIADTDPDELRANLLLADSGVLVAVLAQLTGDSSVVDEFGPKITYVPDPPERAGVTDADTAARLADAIVDALRAASSSETIPEVDLASFTRLVPVVLGSEVDDEQVPLLFEQSGFRPFTPTLPRTTAIPQHDDRGDHRCGPRRHQRRTQRRRSRGGYL